MLIEVWGQIRTTIICVYLRGSAKYFSEKYKSCINSITLKIIMCRKQKKGKIGGRNSLSFSLNHHEYIYKMISLYNR